ncbi:MAG: DJ-1/PfpI family protein [Caulobacter sp.]
MPFDRRSLLGVFAGAAALAPFLAVERAMAAAPPPDLRDIDAQAAEAHMRLMQVPGLNMHGDEQVAMLLYPGFTALDLVGPHYFFGSMMGATVHLVTNQSNLAPVPSDLGLAIAPTTTLVDAPKAPTVLFVPGGTTGTLAAAADPATLVFLRDRSAAARFTTSVCTGSVILGAAGLLRGKRATSHWAVRETLGHFGATPVNERVVVDGKIVTGAGVSAGLDFALTLVEMLRGRPYAEALMLQGEYHPAPPFAGGTPETTDPALAGPLADMFAGLAARVSALPVAA